MSRHTPLTSALVLALALAGTAAYAEPAVIYDMGGKFDKSFNQSAYDLSLIHI